MLNFDNYFYVKNVDVNSEKFLQTVNVILLFKKINK